MDDHAAHRGDAEVHHLAAGRLVLRVAAVAEGGETHFQDAVGVAAVTIDHRARRTENPGAGAHQLTPQGVGRRGPGADIDLVGLQIIERLEHQPNERAMVPPALPRYSGVPTTSASSTVIARPITTMSSRSGWMAAEGTAAGSPLVHDVADHGGEKLAPRENCRTNCSIRDKVN
jgi:hypothetical protein